MNYELARQLRDAGYPQKMSDYNGYEVRGDEHTIIPTLSELIEACPKTFKDEEFDPNEEATFYLKVIGNDWFAGYSYVDREYFPKESIGKTPDEAVARLWLALHSLTQ